MGQAKRRGSREERLAQKLGLVECSIDDLKQNLDIPAEAEFVGYGVHWEVKDEFLSEFHEDAVTIRKIWSKKPEHALLFSKISDAYDTALKCADSVVVGIFEGETQMWVAQVLQ